MRIRRIMTHTSQESGAVAVIVGVLIVVLFGFGAFAVDIGGLWQNRRHVIVATDSASLAAAQEEALGGDGCDTATSYVADNDAEITDCEAISSGSGGQVRVDAANTFKFAFARVFGLDEMDVNASTTAEYNHPSSASGLRPYGLCQKEDGLGWIPGEPPPGEFTFTFTFPNPDGACGSNAGNWGGLEMGSSGRGQGECFDNASFSQCVSEGTDEPVGIGDWIGGAPGSNICKSHPIVNGIEQLIANGTVIGLPVFDDVRGPGGARTDYHISAFVGVVIVDFNEETETGEEEGEETGNSCSITVEFRDVVTEGEWPDGPGPEAGLFAVRICDVDSTDGECGP